MIFADHDQFVPFDVCPTSSEFLQSSGCNSGNNVFEYSIRKMLVAEGVQADVFTDYVHSIAYLEKNVAEKLDDINKNYDALITSPANILSATHKFGYERWNWILERIKIPFHFIGVGAQASIERNLNFIDPVKEDAQKFIKNILKTGGKIAVRGFFTAEVIKHLGFSEKEFSVIGCPSLMLEGRDLKVDYTPVSKAKLKPLLNGFRVWFRPEFKHFFTDYPNSTFVCQDWLYKYLYDIDAKFLDAHKNSPQHDLVYLENGLFAELYKKDRIRVYADYPAWNYDISHRGFNFSFGNRIHGNIVSILSGIPSYVFTEDSRTLELCEYFDIPHGNFEEDGKTDLYDIYKSMDYSDFNKNFPARFDKYKKFIHSCGLPCFEDMKYINDKTAQIPIKLFLPNSTMAQVEAAMQHKPIPPNEDKNTAPIVVERNIIPITFSIDNKYVKHLSVVMNSILQNSSKDFIYEFNIFDNGIRPESVKKLDSFVDKFKNARLRIWDIREKTSQFTTTNIPSAAIFDRLFIPEILTQYDKVLQLDADMVVEGDIAELFNTELGNNYVGAVEDRLIRKQREDKDEIWLRDVPQLKGYNWDTYISRYLKIKKSDGAYFNAGMMLMNLKQMRKDKLSDKLVKYLQEKEPLALCDQDALNAVIGKHKTMLSSKWNFVCEYLNIDKSDDYCIDAQKDGLGIVHKKLWYPDAGEMSPLYWKYLSMDFISTKKTVPKPVQKEDITFVCTGKILPDSHRFSTKESLKSVRKHFPSSRIILSTWDSEDISGLNGFYDELICNKAMSPLYMAHVSWSPVVAPNSYDLQQVCVNSGLKKVKTKYAVRLRTDFILTGDKFLKNYNKFNCIFDVRDTDYQIFDEKVLVHESLTINPFCFAPKLQFTQHPADIFHFGLTSDLLKIWNGEPMPKNVATFFDPKKKNGHENPQLFLSQYIIEQYLWVSLVKRSDIPVDLPKWYYDTNPQTMFGTDMVFLNNLIILNENMLEVKSKFDTIQKKQKFRFYNLLVFSSKYREYLDAKNKTVNNLCYRTIQHEEMKKNLGKSKQHLYKIKEDVLTKSVVDLFKQPVVDFFKHPVAVLWFALKAAVKFLRWKI
jgi:lipopolysaccharide biosynthesis glycosyltransferase